MTRPVSAGVYTDVSFNVECEPDGTAAINVYLNGVWFDTCVPSVTSAEFTGSEIRVRVDVYRSTCFFIFQEWSDSARVEDVPAGVYPVVVDIYWADGSLYESTIHGPVDTHCCPADLAEPFGVLNFFDIGLFLSLFQTQDSTADWNGDGVFNFFDMASYLNAFNGGCP